LISNIETGGLMYLQLKEVNTQIKIALGQLALLSFYKVFAS
jgi:hypothetical protein